MNKVAAIAGLTVREALRQKLAVNLLIFAVALVLGSRIISELTYGEQYRIIADIGLSAMEVFGTLIAIFLGAGLIARDVERRSVYPIIAKPVSRAQYVAGRYVGLVATLLLNLAVMSIFFLGVLAVYLGGFGFLAGTPVVATLCAFAVQFAMVAAVAVFFSSFTTATLSAIFTLSLVVAGHVASDLVSFWSKHGGPAARYAGGALFILVPNLEALNLKEAMIYKDPVPAGFALHGVAYGTVYAAAVIAFAMFVFSRRDLR